MLEGVENKIIVLVILGKNLRKRLGEGKNGVDFDSEGGKIGSELVKFVLVDDGGTDEGFAGFLF